MSRIFRAQNNISEDLEKFLLAKKASDEKYILVEGFRFCDLAISSPYKNTALFFSESFLKSFPERAEVLEKKASDKINIIKISDKFASRISFTKHTQGVFLVIERKFKTYVNKAAAIDMDSRNKPKLLVLERVQDPGNVGSLIRTAEAFSFTDIFYSEGTADPFGDKALRASMGSAFYLNIRAYSQTRDIIDLIKQLKIPSFASAPGAEDIAKCQQNSNKGFALMIGNEAAGLSEGLMKAADNIVGIPMSGRAESLNAAAAGAVLMYKLTEGTLV